MKPPQRVVMYAALTLLVHLIMALHLENQQLYKNCDVNPQDIFWKVHWYMVRGNWYRGSQMLYICTLIMKLLAIVYFSRRKVHLKLSTCIPLIFLGGNDYHVTLLMGLSVKYLVRYTTFFIIMYTIYFGLYCWG
ncbi:hypothetical protein C5167_037069, partial [Papaver somniferum]